MPKPFVNLKNASTRPDGKYKNVIQKIVKDDVCPFCSEYLKKYHKKPIIKTGRFWILTENMYPYTGARHHLLLIHKKHIETIADVSAQAWSELLKLVRREMKKRRIGGGTFYLRFGDTAYTGASVAHLHANLLSLDIRRKNRKPIFTRVG